MQRRRTSSAVATRSHAGRSWGAASRGAPGAGGRRQQQGAGSLAALLQCMLLLPAIISGTPLEASAAGQNTNEVAIMRALRQELHATDAQSLRGVQGWAVTSATSHPCDWALVTCDDMRRIVGISSQPSKERRSGWTGAYGTRPGRRSILLPELAQLQHLEELVVRQPMLALPQARIPAEWFLPGAFPRLRRLIMTFDGLHGGLPPARPGALPQLRLLAIMARDMRAALPASWGLPAVLPSLEQLYLQMQLTGQLPAEWSHGFQSLLVMDVQQPLTAGHVQPGEPTHLPPAWAAGFPLLKSLTLSALRLTGPLPEAWLSEDAFPRLQHLNLDVNDLTGTLPPELFSAHPTLASLVLEHNRFTGTLPAAWATSLVTHLDLEYNALSGAAFPDAWLEPGALQGLQHLVLSHNPNLTGTLPANLPPRLFQLHVDGTAVGGSIPQDWCLVAFAESVMHLFIGEASALDPSVPHCSNGSLEGLQVHTVSSNRSAAGSALAAPPQHPPRALRTWALLATLALLVVAGAAGRVLVRRSLRHRYSQVPGSAGDGASLRLSRRDRLAAQLEAAFGQSRRVELVPRHALPTALTHQLGSVRGTAARRPTLGSVPEARDAAGAGEGSTGEGRLAGGCQPLYPPASGLGSTSGGGLWQQHRSRGLAQATHRSWRLDSRGLELEPDELELVRDASGQLVMLGDGADGVVFLGRLPGMDVAVKVVELPPGVESSMVWGEIALMRECVHPHIVPLYGVATQGQLLLIALGLMKGGSLRQALQAPETKGSFRWEGRGRQVAIDVAEALCFLHDMGVLCNDLKSSNVLLTEDGRGCLADLGVSQKLIGSTAPQGVPGFTITHAAPEQLVGQPCTLASDLFALGILLVELTTGQAILKRGGWRLPRAPQECPQAVLNLIHNCIALEPHRRPTAAQALQRLRAAG